MDAYQTLFSKEYMPYTISLIGFVILILLCFIFYLIYRKFQRAAKYGRGDQIGGFDIGKLDNLKDSIWLSEEERKEIKGKLANQYLQDTQEQSLPGMPFSKEAFLAQAELEAEKIAEQNKGKKQPLESLRKVQATENEKMIKPQTIDPIPEQFDPLDFGDEIQIKEEKPQPTPSLNLDTSKLDASLIETLYQKGAISEEEYQKLKSKD